MDQEGVEQRTGRVWQRVGLLCLAAFAGACAVALLWLSEPDPAYWRERLNHLLAYLEAHPWYLLLALATLPGVGFPISPLFIMTGIVLGGRYGMPIACLLGVAAQCICTTWTYLLAAGPFRQVLTRVLKKRRELPVLDRRNAIRLGLLLRITPGIPYALQNVVLGVIGMPPGAYLAVSLPIASLWSVGFIVTGGAIFEGRSGLALFGLLLLLALALLTKLATSLNRNDV